MSVFNRDMSIEVLNGGRGILTIPEGITELSEDFALVFDWIPEKKCQCSFREIHISSSVQTIKSICLTGYGPDEAPIKRFKKITVSEENPYYTDVDGVLFSKDLTRLICYPCGKNGQTYVVPDTVVVIDRFAFANNINLQKIILPNSLRRIEDEAFFQCQKLSDINLPHGLEYIGEGCFALSTNINRLIVPMSIKRIPTSLFYEGSVVSVPNDEIELEYDYVPTEYLNMPFFGPAIISNHNEDMVDFAESYDYNHFENCYEDRDGIIWANHGKTLVCFPFEWPCEEYELPDMVEEVYIKAFTGTKLKRFYSNHQIVIIGRTEETSKYYEPMTGKKFHITASTIFCDDDKEISTESKSQKVNGDYNYRIDESENKNYLETLDKEEAKKLLVDDHGHIEIPDNIKIIDSYAFNCRKDIVSVTLPDGLTTIRDGAFNACHNLSKINLPQSVISIEDDAFARCFKLDNIRLPDGIECIHSGTFQHCSNLKNITIPATLKTIDRIAFWYCHKLTEIVLPDTVNYIFDNAFDGCNDLSIIAPIGSFAQSFANTHGFHIGSTALNKNESENERETAHYNDTKGYVFISYSTKNQGSADAMRDLLKDMGIKTWMAPGDIPAGSKYAQVISRAVKDCSCFILMLSEDAQNSVWVAKEVERAINYRKHIIPVQIEDVILNDEFELYISTDQIVAVQKLDNESKEIKKLLDSVMSLIRIDENV